jgi:hypothetical protein
MSFSRRFQLRAKKLMPNISEKNPYLRDEVG